MNHTSEPKMIIRRSDERGFEDFGWTDNWMTFSFANYHDPAWINFGPLRVMVENHIQPRSGFPAHPHRDVEIVTYVVSGTLTHGDSFGHKAGITAGEMQLISAGSRGMIHSEESLHDVVEHNYQMWLIPERTGTQFEYHQLKFTPEERQGKFCMYVSPDGENGSMPINTNARIYAGLFSPGDEAVHELRENYGAWIQMVSGEATISGVQMQQGDGIGITNTAKITMNFSKNSEVLLFDLGMNSRLIWR